MVTPQSSLPEQPIRRTRGSSAQRWCLFGAGVLLLLLALGIQHRIRRGASSEQVPPSSDPRLAYNGPFRNIHPEVRYVGDSRCGDCHARETETYRRHPMGRSLLRVADIGSAVACAASNNNPFRALNSLFTLQREDDRLWYREVRLGPEEKPLAASETELRYAIGSGNHGQSFLIDRGGRLFQAPVSWFSSKHIWDLSPGFSEPLRNGRPVEPGCFFCHSDGARHVQGTLNGYEQPPFHGFAIGCERCHGPAERHLQGHQASDGKVDWSIVNPRHLAPDLRDAVCEQCHLAGEARVLRHGRDFYDFRPGLPLQSVLSIFVSSDNRKAVNHVEQMHRSTCFRGSRERADRLGCISCHDPHRKVPSEERIPWFRNACLRCHAEHGCSLPLSKRREKSPEDSCIDCHMPRFASTDIAHHAATDHRILRVPGRETTAGPAFSETLLQPFYPTTPGPEADRDLGLALVQLVTNHPEVASASLPRALRLLDEARRHFPDDVEIGMARSWILRSQGRPWEALVAIRNVLDKAPRLERAQVIAALCAQELGQVDSALLSWQKAIEINPYLAPYHQNRVELLVQANRWDGIETACDTWLRLDPFSVDAHLFKVRSLLHRGEREAARKEFARLEALHPTNLEQLRSWFKEQLR